MAPRLTNVDGAAYCPIRAAIPLSDSPPLSAPSCSSSVSRPAAGLRPRPAPTPESLTARSSLPVSSSVRAHADLGSTRPHRRRPHHKLSALTCARRCPFWPPIAGPAGRCTVPLADAAVDGVVPEGRLVDASKVAEAAAAWLARLDAGDTVLVERRILAGELDPAPPAAEVRIANYGDFAHLNQRWNTTRSGNTHERLA